MGACAQHDCGRGHVAIPATCRHHAIRKTGRNRGPHGLSGLTGREMDDGCSSSNGRWRDKGRVSGPVVVEGANGCEQFETNERRLDRRRPERLFPNERCEGRGAAVERRDFLNEISSVSFAATLGGSFADFARAQDPAPGRGKASDTGSFEGSQVDVAGNTIYIRRYGKGPAILMVHGFPRTSLMWRHLAPQLAENHTVICADLRAYGRSGTPASTDDHIPYSKRAMAKELVDVMTRLGFPTFTLIGHDRGGRV